MAGKPIGFSALAELSYPDFKKDFASLPLRMDQNRAVSLLLESPGETSGVRLLAEGPHLNPPLVAFRIALLTHDLNSYRGDASLDDSQSPGGCVGQVDDAAGNKRSAVVDGDYHTSAGV